jgi:acyl-coenzyme A synthetase/AMP-(fatty) acid ligase
MLARLLQTEWHDRGDEVALVSPSGVLTWRDLVAAIDRHVDEIRALHVTRAVLVLEQEASALALAAACDAAGVTTAYTSAYYGLDMANRLLEGAEAEAVLAVRDGHVAVLARREGTRAASSPTPEVVLLSSGTTGAPKYVRHTWASIAHAVSSHGDRRGDVWLLAYPVAHFAALQVIAQWAASTSTLVIPRDTSPTAAIEALVAHRVTSLSCTPTYLRRALLSAPIERWRQTHLRQLTLGGEIVPQALLDAARAALPDVRIVHIYASTELGAAITVRDGREGFAVALLDGERLKVEDGQLWARRSPRTMLGYVGGSAPEDWVATGDLVEVSQDRVRFLGRTNEVINVGGFKVYPADVEVVVRGVAGVVDACVIGHNSSITGQIVKAIVYVESGRDREDIRRAVVQACAAQLPPHMVPRLYEMTDRADASPTHKLVRDVHG